MLLFIFQLLLSNKLRLFFLSPKFMIIKVPTFFYFDRIFVIKLPSIQSQFSFSFFFAYSFLHKKETAKMNSWFLVCLSYVCLETIWSKSVQSTSLLLLDWLQSSDFIPNFQHSFCDLVPLICFSHFLFKVQPKVLVSSLAQWPNLLHLHIQ